MKLQVAKRAAEKKSEVKKLRRAGNIPAVIYVKEQAGETISLKSTEFAAYLRHIEPGHLPNTLFTLVDESGKERRAIVKDIQYNVVNYNVIHLDFEELIEDQEINVKIPIACIKQDLCPGIKLGGVLRQVIRHLRVRCLPKDIPSVFELDISELNLRQSKRLGDIVLPESVRAMSSLKEVAAVIVKR